jgi:hypothetical protein
MKPTVEGAPELLGTDCDPIAPTTCGLPFPSDVWTVKDPSTPTGKRVYFGKTTLPIFGMGQRVDPKHWADSDGFSSGMAILAHFPGAKTTGLPTQDTIEASLGDSPTVLLEADTGKRIPHFSEIDRSGFRDEERAFMIRPVVRLRDGARYIVAIRRVEGENGLIAPSPAFAALRDGTSSDEPSVERRRGLYADIFGKLAAAGIDKKDLQLAWDFTTASARNNARWLLHMRDDALAKVGEDGPEYKITKIEPDPNPHIWKRIHATFTVPLYLDKPGPGGRLVFGPDGLPKQNGTADYDIVIHVPNAAKTAKLPLLQNGHGLLGSRFEGQNGYLATLADKHGYVAFSVNLVGMEGADVTPLTDTIVKDLGEFRYIVDRQHQGVINSLLAMRMMKGRFARDPEVAGAIDTSRCYYRGDSQGGIFGTTYMALTTDVTRGLLGEPGAPYNLLLNRSTDFRGYLLLVRSAYKNDVEIQIGLGLAQMHWDRTEPNGYLPFINEAPLPGTPKHEILIHVAIGDYQVTPLGAHIIARSVNAKNIAPVNRKLFGIPEATEVNGGSALVEFSFGLPEAPKENVPPPGDDDPHDKVRVLDAAMVQTDRFFKEGIVAPTCKEICDPE